MKRVFQDAPTDEEGRVVIKLGGKCPVCGNGPDMKYATNGKLVMYHLPVECQKHVWAKKRDAQRKRYVQVDEEVA